MKSATGRESTPTRRIWTSVRRPQVATSGSARVISDTKWPKRPTAVMPATALRPTDSITGLNYSCKPQDAKPQAVVRKKVASVEHHWPPETLNRLRLGVCQLYWRL